METKRPLPVLLSVFFIMVLSFNVFAQDEGASEEDMEMGVYQGNKGFHIGFYIGAYFPNKKSTEVYDGYGFDENGNKKDFTSSFMNQKIVVENDPNRGFSDRIASALGVISENWRFLNDTYMPTNLKYNTAFLFGLAAQYGIDKRQAIIANLNFSKLRVVGNFTIDTRNMVNGGVSDWTSNQFALVGREQRMMIQLGYGRLLGESEKANFFIEAGLCLNNAKVEKNFVQINSLEIDLTYYDQNIPGLTNIYYENYTGWGYGGFAGFGLNITMNPNYTVQFLYTPSYESVNLGPEPSTGLSHSVGLRAYYNF